MSRVGKIAVKLSEGVEFDAKDNVVVIKGSKGELSHNFTNEVVFTKEENSVVVSPANNGKVARAMWGTARAVVSNMIEGVTKGFTKELEVNGVGYKISVNDGCLILGLGFSHDVYYAIPEGIEIKCTKNVVNITGSDKQKVGQVAAEIRAFRKPEPYKGKGIKYKGEVIRRKEGKKK